MNRTTYQKAYVESPDSWSDIRLEDVRIELEASCTENIDQALMCMCQGSIIATPWALYRWIME